MNDDYWLTVAKSANLSLRKVERKSKKKKEYTLRKINIKEKTYSDGRKSIIIKGKEYPDFDEEYIIDLVQSLFKGYER